MRIHFNPDPRSESWHDIYVPYAAPAAYCGRAVPVDPPALGAGWLCDPAPAPARPWLGAMALLNLAVLLSVLAALLGVALGGWRTQRRRASVA